MQQLTVRCGCGRTMAPESRRGAGHYRCGCGARIHAAITQPDKRVCWFKGCSILATTADPIQLCHEHEKVTARLVVHESAKGVMKGWVEARNLNGDEWSRPLDSYARVSPEFTQPWVYFMQRERLIKIGTTYHLKQRAAVLNAVILAKTPGSYSEEARMHKRFASLRRHGEWFEPGPELLKLINELRKADGAGPITG
ncbi:GIY-YIG nuclease family protein [Streptomyces rubiginosohelvolus]|uniref:GIY-YIG nuclease family protein n=1 Tax=Streptomyces rubiginosohelvolus TaxID=67362 RepID=UPI00365982CB